MKKGMLIVSAIIEAALGFFFLMLAEEVWQKRELLETIAKAWFVLCGFDVVVWVILSIVSWGFRAEHIQEPSYFGSESSRTCPSCDLPIAPGTSVCPRCKTAIGRPSQKLVRRDCPQCGWEITEDSEYCRHCGAKTNQDSRKRPCIRCGRDVLVGSSFCPYCRATPPWSEQ